MASRWMSVGVVKPMSVTALRRSAGRPRSAKVISSGALRAGASSSPDSSSESSPSRKGARPSTSSSSTSMPSSASSSSWSSGSDSGRASSAAVSTSSSSSSWSTSSGSSGESEEAGVAKDGAEADSVTASARCGAATSSPPSTSSTRVPGVPGDPEALALKRSSRLRGPSLGALVASFVLISVFFPFTSPRRGTHAECGDSSSGGPPAAPHPPHSPCAGTSSRTTAACGLHAQTHGVASGPRRCPGVGAGAPNGVHSTDRSWGHPTGGWCPGVRSAPRSARGHT